MAEETSPPKHGIGSGADPELVTGPLDPGETEEGSTGHIEGRFAEGPDAESANVTDVSETETLVVEDGSGASSDLGTGEGPSGMTVGNP
jgi:hypothetical protein